MEAYFESRDSLKNGANGVVNPLRGIRGIPSDQPMISVHGRSEGCKEYSGTPRCVIVNAKIKHSHACDQSQAFMILMYPESSKTARPLDSSMDWNSSQVMMSNLSFPPLENWIPRVPLIFDGLSPFFLAIVCAFLISILFIDMVIDTGGSPGRYLMVVPFLVDSMDSSVDGLFGCPDLGYY